MRLKLPKQDVMLKYPCVCFFRCNLPQAFAGLCFEKKHSVLKQGGEMTLHLKKKDICGYIGHLEWTR